MGITTESISLWRKDTSAAEWGGAGFDFEVNPSRKRIDDVCEQIPLRKTEPQTHLQETLE